MFRNGGVGGRCHVLVYAAQVHANMKETPYAHPFVVGSAGGNSSRRPRPEVKRSPPPHHECMITTPFLQQCTAGLHFRNAQLAGTSGALSQDMLELLVLLPFLLLDDQLQPPAPMSTYVS